MAEMIEVGIVGGSGYGAIELIRLLQHHPVVHIKYVFSHSKQNESIKGTFSHLYHKDIMFTELDIAEVECDAIFFATPSNVCKKFVPDLLNKGIKVIDLSGDFRLQDPEIYRQYYGEYPLAQKWLKQAVYGLAEQQDNYQDVQLIANPGCFPTASLLALSPLIKAGVIDEEQIIIDAKTGVSGAGRTIKQQTHFPELNENFQAYAIGKHKHTPEINQFLSQLAGHEVKVRFTPHLVPMTRGILATCYVSFKRPVTEEAIRKLYQDEYDSKPFIRIRSSNNFPATKEVSGSNFCDIGLYVDETSQTGIIISVIDNLVKGASGQAIQNMNRLFGLNEQTGLNQTPVYP